MHLHVHVHALQAGCQSTIHFWNHPTTCNTKLCFYKYRYMYMCKLSPPSPPLTVVGSSRGSKISACLRNTFPRHALHSTRSKTGILSRAITPVTNVKRVWGPAWGATSLSVSAACNRPAREGREKEEQRNRGGQIQKCNTCTGTVYMCMYMYTCMYMCMYIQYMSKKTSHKRPVQRTARSRSVPVQCPFDIRSVSVRRPFDSRSF